MIDAKFAETLATTDFARRATFLPDGSVIYRLKDDSGSVRVPRSDWARLGHRFQEDSKPVRRRASMLFIALFPAVFVFALSLGQVLPYAGWMILIGIFGGPLAIYLWHSRQIQLLARELEADLGLYPSHDGAVPPSSREARWFEIAFLVLVGPQILIGIVGEIAGPDLYRGTPLSGRGIGVFELVAMLLIAVRLVRSHGWKRPSAG